MRGKDYNTGLRGVLFEARHYQKMGAALWLYGWLVLRQTRQQGSLGWVLGGAPVRYHEIEEETGFNARTLERWMRVLRHHGYVETEAVPAGVIVRITKAKKFPQPARKTADGVRNPAGPSLQSCVGDRRKLISAQGVGQTIGSSFVVRSKDRNQTAQPSFFHNPNQNQSQNQSQNQNQIARRRAESFHENHPCVDPRRNSHKGGDGAPVDSQTNPLRDTQLYPLRQLFAEWRQHQRLLRVEREQAVRRELAVGTGPEAPRS
jgi:hypothetical protein